MAVDRRRLFRGSAVSATATKRAERVRVLCVDDEPRVLEGIGLHLQRRFEMMSATSGEAGLAELERHRDTAIVMSDMRMPRMNGATFLAKARAIVPDATRILLTGQADLHSAISAVNDGQIFRFLTKPCAPDVLLAAVDTGVAQHRLITAERVLLEQTLHGSIKALTDILAIVHPISFGRASRIKARAAEIAAEMSLPERWQVEVAAMVCQLGAITLPHDTVERVYHGHLLSDAERDMCAKVPAVTEQLLGSIPRLEGVRGILAAYPKPYRTSDDPARQQVLRFAHILRVAIDYDALEAQGEAVSTILDTLRGRDCYDPAVLATMATLRGGIERHEIRELSIAQLRAGMAFVDDVKMTNGTLLVARGCEVTQGFIERVRNFPVGALPDRVRVQVKS